MIYIIKYNIGVAFISNSIIVLIELLKTILKTIISLKSSSFI